jgi:glutathione S-transferase
MKLYYSAGSCSTSCHITLEEAGLKYEVVELDWDVPAQAAEVDRLNPMGTLPVLVTDDGRTLTQNIAIHTYVAELAPEKSLLPKPGTIERAETMNWLSFVASDFHKAYGPIFAAEGYSQDPKEREKFRAWGVSQVEKTLKVLDAGLAGKDYLTGKTFTVADSYAFVVAGWTKWLKIPLDPYRNLQSYLGRVAERPAVQRVLKAEGLL